MKKSIFLFFAAILCAMGVSAKVIYLKPNSNWTQANAAFWVHAWGGTGDIDLKMTPVATDPTTYEAEVGTSTSVIFLRRDPGKDGSNVWDCWNRMGNLAIPADKNCCTIKDGKWSEESNDASSHVTWSTYTPPTVAIPDVYTVVGSSDALGLAWDPSKEANDMEKQDDGSYKKVYSNVELTSDVEWKIAKNDNWWNGPTFNQSNNTLTIAQSGIYNVTFTLSADLATATATADLLEATNTVADCFISGNAALTGGAGWAGNEFKMEYDPATETYSYTLTGLAASTAYEIKVVCGGVWYSFDKLVDPAPANVTEGNDHAIAFQLAEAGDVTVTYHATNGIGLTGNFAAPVTYDYYLTGTLVGGWSATQQGMENVDGLYKAIFTELPAGTYAFKITDGQWNSDGDATHEHTTLGAAYEEVSYHEGNIQIVTEEAINLTVIFDATEDKITFDGLTEKAPEPTFDYYIVGSFNGNDPKKAENGMTLDGAVYKATVTLAAGDNTLKVTKGSWDPTWGYTELGAAYEEVSNPNDGYNNIKITLAAEKEITVIFDATAGKITLDGLTPYVAPLTYTVTVPAGTEKCYIAGSMNGWAFQEMEAVTGETNKFTITIIGAKETDEYKYACQANWAYAEVIEGGGNRTKWSALDEVTAWNAPAEPTEVKCYLMGNGDWDNGVEMTLNPDNDNEYMLLDHYISAPFKFKLGDDWSDQVENYEFPGIDWKDGNIVLPEGIYDFYFKKDSKKAYIAAVYLRDVTNTWGTICLPHASTSFSGAKFYEVSSLDPKKGLWLDEIEAGAQLVAGKPYVFEATASTIKVTYTDAAVAAPVPGAKGLTGTFTDIAAAAGSVLVGNYIIAQNAVHVATASNDLPAYRAYIANTVPTTEQPQLPGRRRVCMGENATTGLDQIVAPEGQAVKAIVNGQLIIIRDGVKYNVQGQVIK